jgi:hypothetical protein
MFFKLFFRGATQNDKNKLKLFFNKKIFFYKTRFATQF